ncbi:hypothetical protein OG976_13980 [Mycobacterium sp. NBC_00419]|uniref:hypothetical protein n=1 Tax=Mycobacterium sp. NBC_00419 TaxID=2975989 RepID=UPI002E200DEC
MDAEADGDNDVDTDIERTRREIDAYPAEWGAKNIVRQWVQQNAPAARLPAALAFTVLGLIIWRRRAASA